MLLFVTEIRHDGLVLRQPKEEVGRYWLPASNRSNTSSLSQTYLADAEPGMAVSISVLHGQHTPAGLQVVTIDGSGANEIDDVWKGEVHAVRIESMSKTLIRGRVGAVDVVIRRDEYTAFLNDYPTSELIQDHGALAVGDWLCGLYVTVDGPEKRVQLSFADARSRISEECEAEVEKRFRRDCGAAAVVEEALPVRASWLRTPADSLGPVLFVEDDALCREMWKGVLTAARVEVDDFAGFAEALTAITNPAHAYKLAILDVHLAGTQDHLGLELARALGKCPGCRVVIASAEDRVERTSQVWGDLRVHGYISKPALLPDWAASIDAAMAAPDSRPLKELLAEAGEEGEGTAGCTPGASPDLLPSKEEVLNEFCREHQALIAHVFRLHPRSWRGRSLAGAGPALNWEPYRGKLKKSLIKDVAESNREVVHDDAGSQRLHLWTKAMVDYRSFWGKRLAVLGSQYRYVLVMFHASRHFFAPEVALRAQCCAEQVASALTREILQRHQVYESEHASAGLGFACLAHEIYTKVHGLGLAVEHMRDLLPPDGSLSIAAGAELRQVVRQLSEHMPNLVANARILRGHAGGDKETSVVFCVEKAIYGIKEAKSTLLKRPDDVVIAFESPETAHDWTIKANAAALVAVFFNVLQNAIQQIELFSAIRSKGSVHVSVQYYEDSARARWARVYIRDSGPGIHPDDWERVFDAGYTTKENGTGLGLHICRQSLRRMHVGSRTASMRIARSVLWGGTTVVIELPLLAPSQGV